MVNTKKYCEIASFIFIIAAILFVLEFKLIGATISGFLVYSICQTISNKLDEKFKLGTIARTISVALLILVVSLGVWGLIIGILHFIKGTGNDGVSLIVLNVADVLDKMRQSLPVFISSHIPPSVDALKIQAVEYLKQNSHQLSTIGVDTLHQLARILIGIVAGAMLSFATFYKSSEYRPLSSALIQRLATLRSSFDKVVSAQVKISLVNTALTAIYLVGIMPLFGIHIPFAKSLILITFVAGMIPVAGNVISNCIMVILSLGVSFKIGVISLVFLVVIHKLEYFLNANIIGNKIKAVAWELILAMLLMEVAFGIAGVIAAPILYAYMKTELLNKKLVGLKTPLEKERETQTET